ncbi:MAG: GDSL-type esterase/lipase family protein [Planctomycetales bacterium]
MRTLSAAPATNRYLVAINLWMLVNIAAAGKPQPPQTSIVPIDDANLLLSPYVWRLTAQGKAARAEAMFPGAYVKMGFEESRSVGLVIDGTANRGCPPESMPVIEYSIDEGEFQIVPLTRTGEVYTLPLGEGLAIDRPHRVELYFRAADLVRSRWKETAAHLRLAGFVLEEPGRVQAVKRRAKRAMAFGDSITEGVGTDGLFTSWQLLLVNNARATWFPLVCAALDCEYGQLGSGGQGMTRAIHLPPLTQTWDRYDDSSTRLVDGRLVPEPDYVFCNMGTNDYEKDITADYVSWLTAVRQACPNTHFFCIVPTLGVHQAEVEAAVATRRTEGDRRVFSIDPAPLRHAFRVGQGATQLAHDGVHPSAYGHALLGALIAAESQKLLSAED